MKRREMILGALAAATMAGRARAQSLIDILFAVPIGEDYKPIPVMQGKQFETGLEFDLSVDEYSNTIWNTQIKMRGYNRTSLPAPLFELPAKGIHKVNITNNLQDNTTVHWHGFDIDPAFDGLPHSPLYPFDSISVLLDMKYVRPGIYWYHPHPHYDVAKQVTEGLAGVILVRESEPIIPPEVEEHVLMFNEIRVNSEMALDGDIKFLNDVMFGREGDFILTNGQLFPILNIKRNTTHRFRMVNSLPSRHLHLNFSNAPIILIGTDGGYLERPVELREISLSPGERADIIVHFTGDAHQEFILKTSLVYRANIVGYYPKTIPNNLLKVILNGDKGKLSKIPNVLSKIERFEKPTAFHNITMNQKDLTISGEHHNEFATLMDSMLHNSLDNNNHNHDHAMPDFAFTFNNKLFDPERIDITAKRGKVEQWTVENQTQMDHPFHIHGGQFQIVARKYKGIISKPKYLAFKDTINIRAGEKITLQMKQYNAGIKMFHCHLLDHEDHGMMGMLQVI